MRSARRQHGSPYSQYIGRLTASSLAPFMRNSTRKSYAEGIHAPTSAARRSHVARRQTGVTECSVNNRIVKFGTKREADMVKQLRPAIVYSGIVLATLGFHRGQTLGAAATKAKAQAGSPAVLITVLSSQVDPTRRKVTFALQNTGTKVITAWDVTIVVGMEPEAKYGGHGVDAFRESEGLVDGRSFIVPGGTVTATANLPFESENLAPVAVTPSAAVFADTSFAGDARFAQLVFARRGVQLAAWQEIVRQLEQIRNTDSGDVGKLDVVLSDVNGSIARNGGDIVRTTFRANLSLSIVNVRAGRRQALPELSRLLTEAHRNVAVATAHSKR